MSDDKLGIVRGNNLIRDAGLPDPDARLMKADLAAGIIRVLREQDLAGAKAAELAGVPEADISRIRNADLGRFTIDRLVKILNRLDQPIEVGGGSASWTSARKQGPGGKGPPASASQDKERAA